MQRGRRFVAHDGTLADAHLVYVTVDALRADRLAPTHAAALGAAARGLAFTRAYAAAPSTAASITALMTAPRPSRLDARPPTLAERLARGWLTAAFYPAGLFFDGGGRAAAVRRRALRRRLGRHAHAAGRGADRRGVWRACAPSRRRRAALALLGALLRSARALRAARPARRRAAVDPLRRRGRAPSTARSARLVDGSTVLARPTLVVVTADHGEEFGEHGGAYHGSSLYDEQLRVPLVVALLGGTLRPRASTTPVSLVDVCADGRARSSTRRAFARCRARFGARRRGRRGDAPHAPARPWKLIHDLRRDVDELYDLAADPDEMRNPSTRAPTSRRAARRAGRDGCTSRRPRCWPRARRPRGRRPRARSGTRARRARSLRRPRALPRAGRPDPAVRAEAALALASAQRGACALARALPRLVDDDGSAIAPPSCWAGCATLPPRRGWRRSPPPLRRGRRRRRRPAREAAHYLGFVGDAGDVAALCAPPPIRACAAPPMSPSAASPGASAIAAPPATCSIALAVEDRPDARADLLGARPGRRQMTPARFRGYSAPHAQSEAVGRTSLSPSLRGPVLSPRDDGAEELLAPDAARHHAVLGRHLLRAGAARPPRHRGQPRARARPTPVDAKARSFRLFVNYAQSITNMYCLHLGQPVPVDAVTVGQRAHLRAAAEGRGAVVVTGHLGFWQIAPILMQRKSYPPLTMAMAEEPNQGTGEWERQFREKFRIVYTTSSPFATLELAQRARRGELVGMQMDRYTGGPHVMVPFCGKPAPFPLGPATLARATGTPLLPTFIIADADRTNCTFHVEAPIEVAHTRDRDADVRDATRAPSPSTSATCAAIPSSGSTSSTSGIRRAAHAPRDGPSAGRARITGVGACRRLRPRRRALVGARSLAGERAMRERPAAPPAGCGRPVALVDELPLSAPSRAATMARWAAEEALADAGGVPQRRAPRRRLRHDARRHRRLAAAGARDDGRGAGDAWRRPRAGARPGRRKRCDRASARAGPRRAVGGVRVGQRRARRRARSVAPRPLRRRARRRRRRAARLRHRGLRRLKAVDAAPCRPFDRRRRGLNLGEAAAFLVLESEAHARARGARIRAFLDGYGVAADAVHMTGPDREGRGAARAMQAALADAGRTADEVDYVSAHGTATPSTTSWRARRSRSSSASAPRRAGQLDQERARPHARRRRRAGGDRLRAHARDGLVPPTPGCEELDPQIALDVVCGAARHVGARVALSTSSGFGGTNAAVVVSAA